MFFSGKAAAALFVVLNILYSDSQYMFFSELFTCCDLTVPQSDGDVINGYKATFPEVRTYADKNYLGYREKD